MGMNRKSIGRLLGEENVDPAERNDSVADAHHQLVEALNKLDVTALRKLYLEQIVNTLDRQDLIEDIVGEASDWAEYGEDLADLTAAAAKLDPKRPTANAAAAKLDPKAPYGESMHGVWCAR